MGGRLILSIVGELHVFTSPTGRPIVSFCFRQVAGGAGGRESSSPERFGGVELSETPLGKAYKLDLVWRSGGGLVVYHGKIYRF